MNERGGGSRLELRSGALRDIGEDAFGFPRIAIRAARTQRVIHIADVHQIAGLVALAMIVTGRVAMTVDHDVMLVGHGGREIELAPTLDDQLRSFHGMILHHQALLVSELARLVENVLGNAHFAEVVQQAGNAECPNILRRQLQRLGERHHQHRHVKRVRGGVFVKLS